MKGTLKNARLQCPQAKRLFSPYLDGVVTGTEMLALQDHFSDCEACSQEYRASAADAAIAGERGPPQSS